MPTGSTTENGEKKSLRKSGQTGTFWPVAGRPPSPTFGGTSLPRAEPPFPYLRWLGSQLIGGAALDGPPRRLFKPRRPGIACRQRTASVRRRRSGPTGPDPARSLYPIRRLPTPRRRGGLPPARQPAANGQNARQRPANGQNARQPAANGQNACQRSPIAALSCVSAINRPERKKALKIADDAMRFGRKPGRSRAFRSPQGPLSCVWVAPGAALADVDRRHPYPAPDAASTRS